MWEDNARQGEITSWEGGHTIQHRHTCGETLENNRRQGETRPREGGHAIQHRHECRKTSRDKTSGRRMDHPTQAHMWADNMANNGKQGDTRPPEGGHTIPKKETRGCWATRRWAIRGRAEGGPVHSPERPSLCRIKSTQNQNSKQKQQQTKKQTKKTTTANTQKN